MKFTNSNRILWAGYLAAIMVLMDLTSVNIAMPSLSRNLGMEMNLISWILMISMLSATSFVLVAGKITQKHYPKKIFIIGFIIFIIGNILSWLVQDYYTLLMVRFVQGFGDSLLYVIGPAFIRQHLKEDKQHAAYGIWMACTGIGIAFGPLLGGLILQYLSPSYVFLINVPFAIIGLVLVIPVGNQAQAQVQTQAQAQADFKGAVLSFVFVGTFILGLNLLSTTELITYAISILVVSIVFLLLFIRHIKKVENPVFEISLFKNMNFSLVAIGFFLFFLVNVGSRFLRPFYFEESKLYSSLLSGWLMMISPMLMLLISPFSSKLSKSVKPKWICVIATLFLSVSMFMFSFWDQNTSIYFIIISMILLGIGMGLFYPTASFIGMKDLDSKNSGMGSAAISTAKSIGKLSGVLFFGLIFSLLSQINYSDVFNADAFQWTFIIATSIALIATLINLKIRV